MGAIPALVLDDGTVLTESVAICRYLDALHPEPSLFGSDARSQALVTMWIRRIELEIMRPLSDMAQHSFEFFAQLMTQIPAYAELQRKTAAEKFRWLDGQLGDHPYLTGDSFIMADILGMSCLFLADFLEAAPDSDLNNLQAWKARLIACPSYDA